MRLLEHNESVDDREAERRGARVAQLEVELDQEAVCLLT